MVVGIIMLLFIGFNRLWHIVYIRLDSLVCGFFQLPVLPAASTFWRYVDSLGINQANALLRIIYMLRERLWQQCGLCYERIHVTVRIPLLRPSTEANRGSVRGTTPGTEEKRDTARC